MKVFLILCAVLFSVHFQSQDKALKVLFKPGIVFDYHYFKYYYYHSNSTHFLLDKGKELGPSLNIFLNASGIELGVGVAHGITLSKQGVYYGALSYELIGQYRNPEKMKAFSVFPRWSFGRKGVFRSQDEWSTYFGNGIGLGLNNWEFSLNFLYYTQKLQRWEESGDNFEQWSASATLIYTIKLRK